MGKDQFRRPAIGTDCPCNFPNGCQLRESLRRCLLVRKPSKSNQREHYNPYGPARHPSPIAASRYAAGKPATACRARRRGIGALQEIDPERCCASSEKPKPKQETSPAQRFAYEAAKSLRLPVRKDSQGCRFGPMESPKDPGLPRKNWNTDCAWLPSGRSATAPIVNQSRVIRQ